MNDKKLRLQVKRSQRKEKTLLCHFFQGFFVKVCLYIPCRLKLLLSRLDEKSVFLREVCADSDGLQSMLMSIEIVFSSIPLVSVPSTLFIFSVSLNGQSLFDIMSPDAADVSVASFETNATVKFFTSLPVA